MIQLQSGVPTTIRNSIHNRTVLYLNTSSFYYFGKRIGKETSRSTPPTSRVPGGIFHTVRNPVQHHCQICKKTSGHNFETPVGVYNLSIKYLLSILCGVVSVLFLICNPAFL
ncbi:hypothetical protein TNCV_548731 [Trichonephila clavipes]|nr:hypothetical protein TNCV_548731 [Trichonephila clavipes]